MEADRKHNIVLKTIMCLLFLIIVRQDSVLLAQCPNDNTFFGVDLTPATCPGNSLYDCAFAGEYVTVNVVVGNTYVFTTCADFLYDTQITLYNQSNGSLIAYNDDDCGLQSTVTWVADFTGTVQVLIDEFPCLSSFDCIPLEVFCFGGSGGGDGLLCSDALPFCTGTNYNFPNNTNVPDLGTINCLFTSPNPVWYYMEIDQPGNLDIDITQVDNFGFPIDIDFSLWGPFADISAACNSINSNVNLNVVDCSYSGSAFEEANITNAQQGEVYVLLLTNFSNQAGTISFNSLASSTATTNCDILCEIVSLSASASACDPTTNTYTVTGTIAVNNPPASGNLTISSSCGGIATYSAPFPLSLNYSIPGVNANGGTCTVTALFSDESSCTETATFTAPASCASVSLNCPQYSNTSGSASVACSNQTYYLEVENTACNGQIYMTVIGDYGSLFPGEISWTLTSNLSGFIAGGDINSTGNPFTIPIGPLNPSTTGTIFTLNVQDSFGDGFDGVNGFVQVMQGSQIIAGPIQGEIGFGANTIFGANISISPATITVNTPAGPVVQTVEFCRDFRVPISINNTNFCNTINVNIPWTITCNANGSLISSGSNNITVYPSLPSASNDVVIIDFNTTTCQWDVSPNNDCDQADIGTVFSISPDPSTVTNPTCIAGSQDFDITYNGLNGGPGCCSTGGPVVPIEQTQILTAGNFQIANSPFGGVNNAAYAQIPANGIGGNATSLTLNFTMNGYCAFPVDFGPGDYWVTIYVDGNIISDITTFPGAPATYNQTINLADIPGGYTSNSTIEIYIYPNSLDTQYAPAVSCGSLLFGQWTNSSLDLSIDIVYSEFEPTPASCLYSTEGSFLCCEPSIISDVTETICSGSSFALQAWINSVNAANSCAVFSSVPPVAAVTLPDNVFPDGINPTSGAITQIVSAYAYCDVNGNGAVGIGDTYTLISTYTLNINVQPNAGTSANLSVCDGAVPVDLFSRLTDSPQSGGVWTGPSSLGNGDLGTFIPGTSTPGLYTYTISGTPPCLDATATVEVTQSQSTEASIIYPGSPFCIDNTNLQSPQITGAAGGTFSVTPAGLTVNGSTGTFTPSAASPGTYLITYSVPPAGTCPGSTAETYVVITAIPASPLISPNPVCEGVSTVMSVSNGSLFEFFINGVSQGLPNSSSTFNFDNPSSGDVFCVRSFPPPPFTFDGNIIENEWSTALSASNPNLASGFGANNNLDALYLQNGGEYLFGALAGQTENNSNNRFLLFIDCLPGGFNNLGAWSVRSNAPYVSVENLNGLITFDPGFNPDFILCMNQANGEAFFDLYDMQNNVNYYLGSDLNSALISSNLLGYQANGGSGNLTQGFEFAVPLSLLGNPTGTISTFAMLVNDPGLGNPAATFISNQFLTPAADGESNYGDGFIDFGAALPNPINFTLGADCFSETCITVSPAITPITSFTYPTETCQDEADINPSPVSGFTTGGSYSSTAGLIIDEITGQIDISASIPDTYTITYTVSAIGCNPASSTDFVIAIFPTPLTTPIYHE